MTILRSTLSLVSHDWQISEDQAERQLAFMNDGAAKAIAEYRRRPTLAQRIAALPEETPKQGKHFPVHIKQVDGKLEIVAVSAIATLVSVKPRSGYSTRGNRFVHKPKGIHKRRWSDQ